MTGPLADALGKSEAFSLFFDTDKDQADLESRTVMARYMLNVEPDLVKTILATDGINKSGFYVDQKATKITFENSGPVQKEGWVPFKAYMANQKRAAEIRKNGTIEKEDRMAKNFFERNGRSPYKKRSQNYARSLEWAEWEDNGKLRKEAKNALLATNYGFKEYINPAQKLRANEYSQDIINIMADIRKEILAIEDLPDGAMPEMGLVFNAVSSLVSRSFRESLSTSTGTSKASVALYKERVESRAIVKEVMEQFSSQPITLTYDNEVEFASAELKAKRPGRPRSADTVMIAVDRKIVRRGKTLRENANDPDVVNLLANARLFLQNDPDKLRRFNLLVNERMAIIAPTLSITGQVQGGL